MGSCAPAADDTLAGFQRPTPRTQAEPPALPPLATSEVDARRPQSEPRSATPLTAPRRASHEAAVQPPAAAASVETRLRVHVVDQPTGATIHSAGMQLDGHGWGYPWEGSRQVTSTKPGQHHLHVYSPHYHRGNSDFFVPQQESLEVEIPISRLNPRTSILAGSATLVDEPTERLVIALQYVGDARERPEAIVVSGMTWTRSDNTFTSPPAARGLHRVHVLHQRAQGLCVDVDLATDRTQEEYRVHVRGAAIPATRDRWDQCLEHPFTYRAERWLAITDFVLMLEAVTGARIRWDRADAEIVFALVEGSIYPNFVETPLRDVLDKIAERLSVAIEFRDGVAWLVRRAAPSRD
jgi:hypothetical protein